METMICFVLLDFNVVSYDVIAKANSGLMLDKANSFGVGRPPNRNSLGMDFQLGQ